MSAKDSGKHILIHQQPPEAFGLVESGVYRSALPGPSNYSFLRSLSFKTLVHLEEAPRTEHSTSSKPSQSAAHDMLRAFLEEQHLQYLHLCEQKDELVKEALELLLDASHHPLVLCCADGIHVTGVVVGCLRKLQEWSFASLIIEYKQYAGTDSALKDHQLVEQFDTDLVDTGNNPPHWWITQMAMLDSERQELAYQEQVAQDSAILYSNLDVLLVHVDTDRDEALQVNRTVKRLAGAHTCSTDSLQIAWQADVRRTTRHHLRNHLARRAWDVLLLHVGSSMGEPKDSDDESDDDTQDTDTDSASVASDKESDANNEAGAGVDNDATAEQGSDATLDADTEDKDGTQEHSHENDDDTLESHQRRRVKQTTRLGQLVADLLASAPRIPDLVLLWAADDDDEDVLEALHTHLRRECRSSMRRKRHSSRHKGAGDSHPQTDRSHRLETHATGANGPLTQHSTKTATITVTPPTARSHYSALLTLNGWQPLVNALTCLFAGQPLQDAKQQTGLAMLHSPVHDSEAATLVHLCHSPSIALTAYRDSQPDASILSRLKYDASTQLVTPRVHFDEKKSLVDDDED